MPDLSSRITFCTVIYVSHSIIFVESWEYTDLTKMVDLLYRKLSSLNKKVCNY